jgi:hypothetical protein
MSTRYSAALDDRGEPNPEPVDRQVQRSRPQLYGTQFVDHGKGLEPQPIEDPEGLEARRAAVGMEPFEEYEATMHQIWKRDSEPGSADRSDDVN